ncbi:hypothetical protein EC991_005862 [Linnemannia zychae]|nr:hypothetical protein EC991_005862 [Linnemannia zychae]
MVNKSANNISTENITAFNNGIVDLGQPAPNTINFGILLPLNLSLQDEYHWRSIVIGGISAIRLAIEEVNAQKILPVNISLTMRNSQNPVRSPSGGSNAMLSAAYFVTSNVSAVIGDTVSWLSEYSAAVTSAVHIPQCSFTSISDDLSSKSLYNYFIRTIPSGDDYATQLLEYIKAMGWRRIGIIHSSNSFGVGLAASIVRRAPTYGIRITLWEATYLHYFNSQGFTQALSTLKSSGSLINLILCTDIDMLRALEEIHKEGMAEYPYVWISFNDIAHDIRTYFSGPNRPPASAFNGLIMADIAYDFEGNPVYDIFFKRWQSLDPNLYPGTGPESILSHAESRAYSCAWMLALGYQQEIENARRRGVSETLIVRDLVTGQFPRTFGNLSDDLFSNIAFDGPAGNITLDDYGNMIGGNWMFYQLQGGASVAVAESRLTMDGEQSITIFPKKHVWPGSRNNQTPLDSPAWVRQNVTWSEPLAKVLVSIATLLALACVLMIGVVIWKRKDPVIKASSPCFCILELIGIIMLCAAIPMKIGETLGPVCYTIALFFMGGINLILSAIVIKNYRVYRIFNNVYSNKIVMRDSVLLKHAGVLFLALMSAPIIYLAVARPQVIYVVIGISSSAFLCLPSNGGNISGSIQMVMALPTAVVLGFAWFLAYKTRDVSANWNEARAISYIVYNLVFTALVYTVSTILYKTMYRASTIIQDIIILYAGFVCLIVLFVPKLLVMWQQRSLSNSRSFGSSDSGALNPEDNLHRIFGGGGGSGSGGSGGDGGSGGMGISASNTHAGLPEVRLRPLDPDIAFSKETGAAMTFEQFEGRLNETAKAVHTRAYSGQSDTRTTDSKGGYEGSRQRSLTFPQAIRPTNPMILRSLTLEHKASSCNAGPESYGLSHSSEVWGSGSSSGNSNSDDYRIMPKIAPDEVVPSALGSGRGIDTARTTDNSNYNNYTLGVHAFGGDKARASSADDQSTIYCGATPGSGSSPSHGPLTSHRSSPFSSTAFGGVGLGSRGEISGGNFDNNNSHDYNQFRMGIFSFGIKDDTQTVPILVIDKRRWRWISRFTARWRAMQIIVVSSLNMIIISDSPQQSLEDTFI